MMEWVNDGDQGAQGECADLGCVRGWRLGGGGGVFLPMVQVVHLP